MAEESPAQEQVRPTVQLECAGCGKTFSKDKRERDRQLRIKADARFFCGHACSSRTNLTGAPSRGRFDHLDAGNRRDKLTPFRYFLRRAIARRKKKGETDLTLEYLRDLWEQQNGKCPLTGWKLNLPGNSDIFADGFKHAYPVSTQ